MAASGDYAETATCHVWAGRPEIRGQQWWWHARLEILLAYYHARCTSSALEVGPYGSFLIATCSYLERKAQY